MMVETKDSYDFLLDYYISCREELTRYGVRFDGCQETAEDLFEACHDKISHLYPLMTMDEYPKVMKRAMGNLYTDKLRHAGYLDHCKFPEKFSPKAVLEIDEQVCRREEMGFLELALSRMNQGDQEILQGDLKPPVISSWVKYQALKRLERKVIEVMAEQQMRHLNEQETLKKEGQE